MDSIRVDTETGCIGRSLPCQSGALYFVVCDDARDALKTRLIKREKFSNIATESLISAYEDDWSKAYYLFLDSRAGAIYLEGELDAFDDPLCAATALPIIFEQLRRVISTDARLLLEQILSRRVFRYTGYY